MVPPNKLGHDLNGKAVNETEYRGMTGSLMYLTASRPDIQFSTCLYARYQANPKESHLIAVKRIFMYLKGTPSHGLWYPKCSGFDLKGYSDSDYAGCNMDRKSTSSSCQFLGGKLVLTFCDDTSVIAISNNPILHSRTKQIDIREPFILSANMYKEYLAEFWYSAKALENSKVSLSVPTSVRPWFETIGYGETVPAKGTLKKSLLPRRWSLANGINIDYASIFWQDIIIKLNKRHREKVTPYTRFLTLLMMHTMKEGYRDGEVTPYPTQVFSV
ncbi:hypothetical protein Tco_0727011 [Tanacetum coccineum]|uniref:Retrovirus-related Pol polyprotein from transposon RE1 n=1 Tax=Tanacetum coccineum TaxID=301880 RepID=A0ABQ4YHU6_9ASTR